MEERRESNRDELFHQVEKEETTRRQTQEQELVSRLAAEAEQLKATETERLRVWAARTKEEHEAELKQRVLASLLAKVQPYEERLARKKLMLDNEKRNLAHPPTEKHQQQILLQVVLGDGKGRPLKPRMSRKLRITADSSLSQLPTLLCSLFDCPLKKAPQAKLFSKQGPLSSEDLMMKEPQALFLPLKETGSKPPPQNTLVAYLPGASKYQSDTDVEGEDAMEVLSLMDRPFEPSTEQEAKVDHDKPESSEDHAEEEEEAAADYEDESHEAKEAEDPASKLDTVLEEIKAYGMLLARETQRHLHNIATEFYEQLKQEIQKCEASTQAQCENYLAAVEACKIFEREQEHQVRAKIEVIELKLKRVNHKLEAIRKRKNKDAPEEVEVQWGGRTSCMRLDRFDTTLSTRAVVDRVMSSFKLHDKHTFLEDGQGFVLLTDYSEDLCALFWGQPIIRLVLRVPQEETIQRIEREKRKERGRLQLQREKDFAARFRDASALATFDDLPWSHYMGASRKSELVRSFIPKLDDAYDMLDASAGFTLKQITKHYRDRMLFWHSDKFHYPLHPEHEIKITATCKLVCEMYNDAHERIKKEHHHKYETGLEEEEPAHG